MGRPRVLRNLDRHYPFNNLSLRSGTGIFRGREWWMDIIQPVHFKDAVPVHRRTKNASFTTKGGRRRRRDHKSGSEAGCVRCGEGPAFRKARQPGAPSRGNSYVDTATRGPFWAGRFDGSRRIFDSAGPGNRSVRRGESRPRRWKKSRDSKACQSRKPTEGGSTAYWPLLRGLARFIRVVNRQANWTRALRMFQKSADGKLGTQLLCGRLRSWPPCG